MSHAGYIFMLLHCTDAKATCAHLMMEPDKTSVTCVPILHSTHPQSSSSTSAGGRKPSLRSTARLGVAEKLAECIRTLGKCSALVDGRMPLAHSLGQQSDLVELMSLRWLIEPQSLGCLPFDKSSLTERKGKKRR